MDAIVRMKLFGGFMLEYDNTPVNIPSQRIQALLAYLALHRTETQTRQRLAFLLWPDSTESQAYTNLRTLLHRLHAAFPQVDALIKVDAQAIAWQPFTLLDLDVESFEQALRQARTVEPDDLLAALEALERAVSYYSSDLLPDCYDEWLLSERERLRHLLFTALERLVAILEQRRSYAAAIPYTRRLVSLDSLNEVVYLALMRLYTLNGDRASALRVYHSCTSTLQTELGTRPGIALQEAYQALLAAEANPSLEIVSNGGNAAPLVGRVREWRRMQAAWQSADSGQSRLLILWGEAGIGKTRLAEEFLSWAKRQGIITAIAHCYAAEGDLAYAPVSALLRSEALKLGIARLSREWLLEVSRLAPEVLKAAPELPSRPMTEPWQRQRLFEALAKAVLASSRSLMLIDDLHWCDRDTLEWIHFLLRYQPRARLLVVATIRSEEAGVNSALTQLLEALRREGRTTEISLGRLSHEETGELAERIAGQPLSRERIDYLYQETEGNPLFVVEILRVPTWIDSSENNQSPSRAETFVQLPGIQAVVSRRLGQLSPAARAILEVAAVIGRSFTFGVVAQATHLDEDAVVRGLDELWQRRIVREHGADAYDFTHGKLRDGGYLELSAARQRVLHRRVAEAMEREYAANLDSVSGQVAMHYQRAGRASQAAAFYQRAAQFARQLYANNVAITYLQQALALLDAQQSEVAGLCDQLGEVLHFVGRYSDARDAWQRALDLTPENDPITRAHLYRKLGNAWRDQYRYDEAQNGYDAAEATLGDPDVGDSEATWDCWEQIQLERINVLYWLGKTREMLELIDQLRRIFELHGSSIQHARLHQISAIALLRASRYDVSAGAVEHARAYLTLMNEAHETSTLPAAHFQLGFILLWATSDLDTARQEIQKALALAQQSGDISLEGRCLTYLTVIARMKSEIEQVRDYAQRSLRVAEMGQMDDYIGAAQGNLAWLSWRDGDMTGTRSHGQAALAAWSRLPAAYMFEWIGRLPLIGLALEEDKLPEALAQARILLDEQQKRMPSQVELALEAAVRAEDEPSTSRTFLQQAVEFAHQYGYL